MRNSLVLHLSFCLVLAAMPARADDPIAMRPLPPGQTQDCAGHQLLRPVMATHTIPPYPQVSVMTNEQGTVLLDVVIGTQGVPTDVIIATSSGSLRLDEAARDFVKSNWKWQPPLNDCKPVSAKTRVSIKWDLRDAGPGLSSALLAGFDPARMLDTLVVKIADPAEYPADQPALIKPAAIVMMIVAGASGQITPIPLSPANPALNAKSVEIAKTYHWPRPTMDGKPVGAIYPLLLVWPVPGMPVPKADDIKSVISMFAPPAAAPLPK